MADRDILHRLERYLARYGEPESATVPVPQHSFGHVIVVPCYDESPDCLETVFARVDRAPVDINTHLDGASDQGGGSKADMQSAPQASHGHNTLPGRHGRNLLAIVVVNAPDDAPPAPLARTRALWHSLVGETTKQLSLPEFTAGESPPGSGRVPANRATSTAVASTPQPRRTRHTADAEPQQRGGIIGEPPGRVRNPDTAPIGRCRWTRTANGIDVLAIDRVTPNRQLPRRLGVGLARKIGADVACALILKGAIRCPWLYFTDADVRLPQGYLRHSSLAPGCVLFPYRHETGEVRRNSGSRKWNPGADRGQFRNNGHDISRAPKSGPVPDAALAERARFYELHLRYYVDRLRRAGSPYAFHTIGSTLAIHAEVYAKVRGVPKRNAGEDFHLLNKAAKVAPVYTVTGPEVRIRARLSSRVPFGTGPALHAMLDPPAFPSYAHESFELLREAIAFIETGAAVSPQTQNLLEALGFFRHLNSARGRHRHPHTLRKSLHQWFDALRTLRFIHLARRYHPDRPLTPMLDELFGKADHLPAFRARDSERMRILGLGR